MRDKNKDTNNTAKTASDRAASEKNGTRDGSSDVRLVNYEETQQVPAEPPPAQAPPPAQSSPEVVPPPKGIPAKKPAANVAPKNSEQTTPITVGSDKQITIHVDDLDVRKALEILSRQTGMSIVVSPSVVGKVTLDLRDKSADEVLAVIAKIGKLNVQRVDDMIFVAAKSEMAEGEDGKLPVRVYRLNYVRSTDILDMIKPLLSPRGTISGSPDSETGIKTDQTKSGGNAMAGGEIVIVQDYENVLKAIDRVVAQIDVQPEQVLIEAVIVSVKLEKGMDLGVNFGLLDNAQNMLGVVGSGGVINAAAGFSPASVVGDIANSVVKGNEYKSNATPATVITSKTTQTTKGQMRGSMATDENGVKFGWTGRNTTGFIRALEGVGETKVLACPRLLVLNKQRAEIQLGDRLGYKTSTQTQTSTVEKVDYMDVGTLLRIRPFISSDGMIRMEIHPERSSGELDIRDVPQTHTAQVTSNVLVPDGTTIVIGGLIDHEITTAFEGIPFLCRLPWIGSLFRETTTERTKKELIVILTPHIWRPQAPCATNNLGQPRALGLESRVSTLPKATGEDPPSLFTIPPEAKPSDISPPPKTNVGQKKPKRQSPTDFYAVPRSCPRPVAGEPPSDEEVITDAPMPESVAPSPPESATPPAEGETPEGTIIYRKDFLGSAE